MIQVVVNPEQPALNIYENFICLSFQNVTSSNDAGEFQQDTFVQFSTEQDLTVHCACIAQLFSRNPDLREVLEVAIAMSYNNDSKQN